MEEVGSAHSHPVQGPFLSQVDAINQVAKQKQYPDSFQIVFSPNSSCSWSIFHITEHGLHVHDLTGFRTMREKNMSRGIFSPAMHVKLVDSDHFRIVDLRHSEVHFSDMSEFFD